MDYEKKYKQLHTLINDLYPYMSEYCKEKVEGFSPELVESEDGRIRRALIEWVKRIKRYKEQGICSPEIFNGISSDNILTWLEKQKETFTKKDVDDAYLKGVCDAKQEFEKQDESIEIKRGKNYLCTKTHKYAGEEWREGIEYYAAEDYTLINQGCAYYCPPWSKEEHNDCFKKVEYTKVNPRFKVGDVMRTLQEADDNITSGLPVIVFVGNEYYHCTNELIAIKDQNDYEYPPMNRMQESTDKVEPKFKVGEWITDGENIWKIAGIRQLDYLLQSQNGDVVNVIISYVDEHFHLWTIKDARDGEILVDDIDGRPFIFKDFSDSSYPNSPVAYCGINSECDFRVSYGSYRWTDKDVKPSTKEERDRLFQKMEKAGYKWDSQNKQILSRIN